MKRSSITRHNPEYERTGRRTGSIDNSSGDVLRRGLEARGLQVATATPSKRANGILLAAKRPFQFRCGTPLGAMNGAMIVVDFGSECRMLAAYFPQGKAKVPFFRFCTGEAQAAHNIPFVLPPVTSPILKPERSASACSPRSATRTKRKDRRWAGDCRDP